MRDEEGQAGAPGPPTGNSNSRTHGAHASDLGAATVERMEDLTRECPWLEQDAYRSLLAAMARTEEQILRLHTWLEIRGQLDGKGRPRAAMKLLDSLEDRLARLRAECGMTPESTVKLNLEDRWKAMSERDAERYVTATLETAGEFMSEAEVAEFRRRLGQRLRRIADPDVPEPEPREPRERPELEEPKPALSPVDLGGPDAS